MKHSRTHLLSALAGAAICGLFLLSLAAIPVQGGEAQRVTVIGPVTVAGIPAAAQLINFESSVMGGNGSSGFTVPNNDAISFYTVPFDKTLVITDWSCPINPQFVKFVEAQGGIETTKLGRGDINKAVLPLVFSAGSDLMFRNAGPTSEGVEVTFSGYLADV